MSTEEYNFYSPEEALIKSRELIDEKRRSIKSFDELIVLTEELIRNYSNVDPEQANIYRRELEKYTEIRDNEAAVKKGIEEFYDFVYKKVYGTLPN